MIASFKLTGQPGTESVRVEVGGHNIAHHIDRVAFDVAAHGENMLPRVVVQVVGLPEFDIPRADVVLTAAQAAVLERLGWTPPPAITP